MPEPRSLSTPPAETRTGKTLVFHIGDHKAGSTTIQNALATGRVSVEGHELFYPAELNHNYLVKYFESQRGKKLSLRMLSHRRVLNDLASQIKKSTADICVISAESFESIPPALFRKVVERHFANVVDDIRVVCYVRPHSPRFLSSYVERIKIGVFLDDMSKFFDLMLDRKKLFFAPRLDAWRETFGDRFILRPLIRSELAGGDVLEDFLTIAARDDAKVTVSPGPQSNESLSLQDLVLVRFMQGKLHKKSKGLRHSLGWELAESFGRLAPKSDKPEKLHLPRGLARKLAKTYQDDARAVDAAYFDGRPLLETELQTALENSKPGVASLEPADHFTPQEQRNIEVLANMILAMTKNREGNWTGFFRQERAKTLHKSTGKTQAGKANKPNKTVRA